MRDIEHGVAALATQTILVLRPFRWFGTVSELAGLGIGPGIKPLRKPVVCLERESAVETMSYLCCRAVVAGRHAVCNPRQSTEVRVYAKQLIEVGGIEQVALYAVDLLVAFEVHTGCA